MARLNKQVLGRVRGSLGDIVFREKNGKNFIAMKPSSFTPGSDEASVARRVKFALAAKLASTINNNPALKTVWSESAPVGLSSHNDILRQNYPFVELDNISGLIKLLPDAGFSTAASNLAISATDISVNIGPIGTLTGINITDEPNCRSYALVYLNGPVKDSVSPYSFMLFTSANQTTQLDVELAFNFQLSNQDSLLISKYNTSSVFFAFVTVDADDKIISNSSTLISQ
jgi:hypothetical protein